VEHEAVTIAPIIVVLKVTQIVPKSGYTFRATREKSYSWTREMAFSVWITCLWSLERL
jgi:hypothetical protein